jgi:hypothetical protein
VHNKIENRSIVAYGCLRKALVDKEMPTEQKGLEEDEVIDGEGSS